MTTIDPMAKTRNPHGNVADEDDIKLSMDIARRITVLCEMHGFTLRDLEVRSGLANGSLAGVVSGRRAGATSVRLVLRIAEALGVDVGFLITGRARRHGQPLGTSGDGSSQLSLFEQAAAGPPTHAPRPLKSRKKPPQKRTPRRP